MDFIPRMVGQKVEDVVEGVMNKVTGKDGNEEEKGGMDKVMSMVGGGGGGGLDIGNALSMVTGGDKDDKKGGFGLGDALSMVGGKGDDDKKEEGGGGANVMNALGGLFN